MPVVRGTSISPVPWWRSTSFSAIPLRSFSYVIEGLSKRSLDGGSFRDDANPRAAAVAAAAALYQVKSDNCVRRGWFMGSTL